MNKPRMYYFGPWDGAGHYWHDETGRSVWNIPVPWRPGDVDGKMQPHSDPDCEYLSGHRYCRCPEPEGVARLHKKNGWTAISFWDRTVDTRGKCNSTYVAEGDFTFEQMVEMASKRFAHRWNKMNFPVVLAQETKK